MISASIHRRRRVARLAVLILIPLAAPLALLGTGCSADDDPSTPVPGVPDGPGDDSTTSSLGPGATPPPNPDAGGGGPVPSAP